MMEKTIKHTLKITVALILTVALLVAMFVGIYGGKQDNTTVAADASSVAKANIGATNVGKVDVQFVEGQTTDDEVRARWNANGYTVKWINNDADLVAVLNPSASGEGGVTGTNIIAVLNQNITWNIDTMVEVGAQKFEGIIDGNGYTLNLYLDTYGNKGSNSNYYKVTTSEPALGDSTGNFDRWGNFDGETDNYAKNVRGMGLIAGVNAGTIANMKIVYTADPEDMAAPQITGSSITGTNSLDSAEDPDVPYAYGIITGVNLGTITNVYLDQQSLFNGDTQASRNYGSFPNYWARAFRNTSIVGAVTGLNAGYGSINNCYVNIGADIWAQADGSANNGAYHHYATALAGGIAGSITGDNCKINYCYLTGTGNINAWSMRGYNEDQFLASAGGVTSGKIVVGSNYIEALNMNLNQVKGIISDWQGKRRDSHHKGNLTTATGFMNNTNQAIGTLFGFVTGDTVSDHQDFIITLYSLKKANDNNANLTLDTNSGKNNSWIEIYPEKQSAYVNDTIEVTFEGERVRIATKSQTFLNHIKNNPNIYDNVKNIDDVKYSDANNNGNYSITYDSSYTGSMIWGLNIYELGSGIAPESKEYSTVVKPTEKAGSSVKYLSSGSYAGSYVYKFGAIYNYEIKSNITNTKYYDGTSISSIKPSLVLKAYINGVTSDITPNEGSYQWVIKNSNGNTVNEQDCIYPDIYKYSLTTAQSKDFSYYDEATRILAINKNDSSSVVIRKAELNLSYDYSSQWMPRADVRVNFTSGGSIVSNQVIDAYSYAGGSNSSIIDFTASLTNNNFIITETASTPSTGSIISNVKAYKKVANADGSFKYVEVADSSLAQSKTAVIKIDATAPVLMNESYYLMGQFNGETNLNNIYNLIRNSAEGTYTKISKSELESGRYYNQEVLAVLSVSDENRSGIKSLTVSESVDGKAFTSISENPEKYVRTGNAAARVLLVKIQNAPYIQIKTEDISSNSATINSNNGIAVNVDTTPITFMQDESDDNAVFYDYMPYVYDYQYIYNYELDKPVGFAPLGIKFMPSFGKAGLKMSYMVVEKSQMTEQGPQATDSGWVAYDRDFSAGDSVELSLQGVEILNESAVYLKFESNTDYQVAEPVIVKLKSYIGEKDYYADTFTVILRDAINIRINTMDIVEFDGDGNIINRYDLYTMFNDASQSAILADLLAKTYDGTTAVDSNKVAVVFKDELTALTAENYQGSFRNVDQIDFNANFKNYIKFVFEFVSPEASEQAVVRFYLTNADGSKYDINFGVIDSEVGTDKKDYLEIVSKIDKQVQTVTTEQLFQYAQGMPSYAQFENDILKWNFGNFFDGTEISMPDTQGGTIYFRLKAVGDSYEKYLNVGGAYSVIVDAIKLVEQGQNASDVEYQMLTLNQDGVYTGDAGKNYIINITGVTAIQVIPMEVRVNFELDGNSAYSANITYDTKEHTIKAYYTDVDGVRQEAKVVWYNDIDQPLSGSSIKNIGTYKAKATIGSNNYVIKGQSEQIIKIIATYLDVNVDDLQLQYTGKPLQYIPTVVTGLPSDVVPVFTFTYYDGNTLNQLNDVVGVTEVGTYYVRVVFDPEKQTNEDLKVYGKMEYFKSSGSGTGIEAYTKLTIVPADTVITDADNQSVNFIRGALQKYDSSNVNVKTAQSSISIDGAEVELQYWDENSEQYLPVTSEAGGFMNVGKYKYALYYAGNNNYNPCLKEVVLEIKPIDITGVIFGQNNLEGENPSLYGIKKVYDTQKTTLEANLTMSNVSGQNAVLSYKYIGTLGTFVSTPPSFTDVGRYEVTVRIECENYNTKELTAMIIITMAEFPEDAITFTGNGQYIEVTYDGNQHAVTYNLNKEKYPKINVVESMTKATDVGTYNGKIVVTIVNYGEKEFETQIIINPVKVNNSDIDYSSIEELQQTEGLNSNTDLSNLTVKFTGVNGEEIEVDLIFKNADGEIVQLDEDGCLPAGEYTVEYNIGGNYVVAGDNVGLKLTIDQGVENPDGDNEKPNPDDCQHSDANGDNICDNCGAIMGSVEQPKDTNYTVYIVLGVVGAVILVLVIILIIVSVKRAKRNKQNRRNII